MLTQVADRGAHVFLLQAAEAALAPLALPHRAEVEGDDGEAGAVEERQEADHRLAVGAIAVADAGAGVGAGPRHVPAFEPQPVGGGGGDGLVLGTGVGRRPWSGDADLMEETPDRKPRLNSSHIT